MVTLVNRAKVSTATTGTGTITLGAAEVGYQTFADAGVVDTNVVRYVIEDGTAWEIGTGTYTASGTTLTRTVSESSNADAAISLTGSAVVYVTAAGADLVQPTDIGVTVQGYTAVLQNTTASFLTADELKLDGIEAGATADQTAAEILTAIKTVDGTTSGLDADLLDGLHASSFLQGNQTITLSGDLTGSGTTSINAQLAANVVNANELNVVGNGTTDQYLRSDGDGTFTWATPTDTNTTYSAGTGITLTGTTFTVVGGTGITATTGGVSITSSGVGATQLAVTGNGTTDQYLRSDGDGTFTWATPQVPTNPTISGAILNDGYTEEVFVVTGTTPALSPNNGSIQTWALTANSTPTAGTWAAGQSITLMIDDGTARTVTWPTITWKTNGGVAPTLNTTGYTVIQLWKVSTLIYGARVGDA